MVFLGVLVLAPGALTASQGLLPPDADARVGLLHGMVLCVQQAAGLLGALTLQPVLVQLLDPRCVFGCLIPHHAVQFFHLLEELPALHIWGLELAPSIQAACSRAQAWWWEVRV